MSALIAKLLVDPDFSDIDLDLTEERYHGLKESLNDCHWLDRGLVEWCLVLTSLPLQKYLELPEVIRVVVHKVWRASKFEPMTIKQMIDKLSELDQDSYFLQYDYLAGQVFGARELTTTERTSVFAANTIIALG